VYQVPTLEEIGKAEEVVRGMDLFGGDAYGELDFESMEFNQEAS
jgi:hypothetical protein